MPKLFHCDPPVPPPGPRPTCRCFNFNGPRHQGLPVLHADPQDTSCNAWEIVNANIAGAAARRDTVLEPLAGLNGEQRQQIVTLPASIGQLTAVRELRLYGSHLVRLPTEIGGMASLSYLDVYTSYRLHYLPYEITKCRALKESRASTRAFYGNRKYRPAFPHLGLAENSPALGQMLPACCSVCDRPLEHAPVRRWITLGVGADWMPLLVHACSAACIKALPDTPPDYVQGPHTGGHHIIQSPPQS
jgi:hypothetical protein